MLSPTEHETWRRGNLCFYCGYPNHEVASCPMWGKVPTSSNLAQRTLTLSYAVIPTQFLSIQSFPLNAEIKHSGNVFILSALIDSGAADNFIDHNTAVQLKLPLQSLPHPLKISTIDGVPIESGLPKPFYFKSVACIRNPSNF